MGNSRSFERTRTPLAKATTEQRREVLDRLTRGESFGDVAAWLTAEGVPYSARAIEDFSLTWLPAARVTNDLQLWAAMYGVEDPEDLTGVALARMGESILFQLMIALSQEVGTATKSERKDILYQLNTAASTMASLNRSSLASAKLRQDLSAILSAKFSEAEGEINKGRKVDEEFLRRLADDVLGLLR